MLSYSAFIMLACAAAFYKVGDIEYGKGILLAVVSIGLWQLTSRLFGWNWPLCVVAQVALFFLLTLINISKKA